MVSRFYWLMKHALLKICIKPVPDQDIKQVQDVTYLRQKRQLQVTFEGDILKTFSAQYLREQSPSAEVRGHGNAPRRPVIGAEKVDIIGLEPVGNYAVRLIFSDGHDSGLYSWHFLWQLAASSD